MIKGLYGSFIIVSMLAGSTLAFSINGLSSIKQPQAVQSAFMLPQDSLEDKTDIIDAVSNRRDILKKSFAVSSLFIAAVVTPTSPSHALNRYPADNEIIKEQRTVVSKLDINNAPVADYMQYPGMYPTIGGKIANNGPFASLKEVYKLQLLSNAEKATIKKYEMALTATPATGLDTMRGRDPYRRSFNR